MSKPIKQTFAADQTGQRLANPILVDFNRTGAYFSVLTTFAGSAPKYNIEFNLGKVDTSGELNTNQQTVIDPDGWFTATTPDTSELTTAAFIPFQFPVYAIQVTVLEVGTSTGTITVLQQGSGV